MSRACRCHYSLSATHTPGGLHYYPSSVCGSTHVRREPCVYIYGVSSRSAQQGKMDGDRRRGGAGSTGGCQAPPCGVLSSLLGALLPLCRPPFRPFPGMGRLLPLALGRHGNTAARLSRAFISTTQHPSHLPLRYMPALLSLQCTHTPTHPPLPPPGGTARQRAGGLDGDHARRLVPQARPHHAYDPHGPTITRPQQQLWVLPWVSWPAEWARARKVAGPSSSRSISSSLAAVTTYTQPSSGSHSGPCRDETEDEV